MRLPRSNITFGWHNEYTIYPPSGRSETKDRQPLSCYTLQRDRRFLLMEGDDGRIYVTRKKAILSREQKVGFGMVTTFGALALVFGVFYMWKHVASPFVLTYTGPKFLTGDEKQQQEMETLRKEDTDADGLDDYNELYVYKTSPYLPDSDSDGSADKDEISGGTDPNCAPNQPCATALVAAVNPATLKGSFAEEIVDETGAVVAAGAPTVPTMATMTTALENMSPAQMRELLVQAGGDAATINALTDDEVRSTLMAAISQLQASAAKTEADASVTGEGDTAVGSSTTTP